MAAKRTPPKSTAVMIPAVERLIYVIRGRKVMLDSDLATLYEVETKALNRAVKRNLDRFPAEFMFQLTRTEAAALASSNGRGGRRYLPYAFTEHGTLMLASVLQSARAVHVSIQVVRAFIKLRKLLAAHEDLAKRLDLLSRTQKEQGEKIDVVYTYLGKLIAPPPDKPRRRIGFRPTV